MNGEHNEQKYLTGQEIKNILSLVEKPGLRYTVDLYLLDYIKCCLLEEGQLDNNIQKLKDALDHVDSADARKNIEDVIGSLQCVQKEYNEYQKDTAILASGEFPSTTGTEET